MQEDGEGGVQIAECMEKRIREGEGMSEGDKPIRRGKSGRCIGSG
jgi:hypothetical protein